ncbi:MAG: hypothetical protein WA902_18885, partial [Thermosynechococcaceae cyanobacterium]
MLSPQKWSHCVGRVPRLEASGVGAGAANTEEIADSEKILNGIEIASFSFTRRSKSIHSRTHK